MIKVAVCDFDDTLVCERRFVESGFLCCASFAASLGADSAAAERCFKQEFAVSPKNVFDRALVKIFGAADAKLVAEFVKIYREHKPDIAYEPDVAPFLRLCKKSMLTMAILTDGNALTQHNKLEAVGASSDFEKIIVSSDFGADYCKPSVKPFEMLSEFFGAAFDEMLYIGDNPQKDFAVREKIPINTVRIVRAGGIYADARYKNGIVEMFRINSLPEIFETPLFM